MVTPHARVYTHLMPRASLTLGVEAQQVLDELWREKLVPFVLHVGKITKASGQYTIHFYDSRIRTAPVPLLEGHSFREMVRSAVLDRVTELSGPLKNWSKKRSD